MSLINDSEQVRQMKRQMSKLHQSNTKRMITMKSLRAGGIRNTNQNNAPHLKKKRTTLGLSNAHETDSIYIEEDLVDEEFQLGKPLQFRS